MKKISALIVCVSLFLLLLCPALSAQAAELNSFLTFHEIVTEEGQSDLLVYGTVLPENGTLTLSIDSQQIPNPVLSTVRQEKRPVTVYCLVDISNHMAQKQVQQQQDILNIISSRMGDQDTMVITTVGSKTVEGAVLDNLEARKTAISTLQRDGTKADMYQAIVDTMTSLEQKTAYNTNRCLLILSDGIVSSTSGATEQQALNAIASTSIPVYAIGITGDSASSYSVENARHMLKMAEASQGGTGCIPAQESISAADGAQQIWEHIQDSAVIKVNLSTVTSTSNNATVRASYELADTRLEDTISVDLTMLPAVITDETASATGETEEVNECEEAGAEKSWLAENVLIVAGCGIAAVAVIVVLILVFGSKARKQQEKKRLDAEKAVDSTPNNSPAVDTILSTGDLENTAVVNTMQGVAQGYVKTAPVESDDGVTVQMVVVSHRDVSISFDLHAHKPQVLGRDDRADIIINGEDYQLSGKHCMVEWDGNYLYIQDMGSTNGTILNSINLKPNTWSRLVNGSVLHMGSFDYQVSILI